MTDTSPELSHKYFEGVLMAYRDCLGLLELSANKAPGVVEFLMANSVEKRDAECASAGMMGLASELSAAVRAKIANIELLLSNGGEA